MPSPAKVIAAFRLGRALPDLITLTQGPNLAFIFIGFLASLTPGDPVTGDETDSVPFPRHRVPRAGQVAWPGALTALF